MEREAKDHPSLRGTTSATSSVGRIRSRLPIFAGAHDEVAGAIPVPAELLDHAEQSLRRLDTEAHALRQVATKRLSPWCCSGLCFRPTPSRVGRSGATAKPQDGSPPKLIQAAAPPPYGARTRTACRKSLSPRSPALGRAHHECAPPTNGSRADFGNCDSLLRQPASRRPPTTSVDRVVSHAPRRSTRVADEKVDADGSGLK